MLVDELVVAYVVTMAVAGEQVDNASGPMNKALINRSTKLYHNTVNLEIFVVNIFSQSMAATKISVRY